MGSGTRLEGVVASELGVCLDKEGVYEVSAQRVLLNEGGSSLVDEEEQEISIDNEIEIWWAKVDVREDNSGNNLNCAEGIDQDSVNNENTHIIFDEDVVWVSFVNN
jgi:hypothetical protein